MLDVTKVALNTSLTVINSGLVISTPNLARKFITQYYNLCPVGVYECPKERYYFIAINLVLYLSAILGCFIGLLFKSANRRNRLIGIHYLFIVSGLLSLFAPHFILFLLVQAISGVALGLTIVTVTVYIYEYTPRIYHKYYGSFLQTFFAIGLFLSYIFGVCYENIDTPSYDTVAIIVKTLQKFHSGLLVIISGIALCFLYFVFKFDTPYHLYATKNYEKYDKLKMKMKSFRNIDEHVEFDNPPKKKTIIVLIERDLPLVDVFVEKEFRNLVLIGSVLCLCFALNGYFFFFANSFLFYKIFESMLINNLFTLGFIFVYLIFSIATMALLLNFKKKTLLCSGLIIQILALLGIIILHFVGTSTLLTEIILTICMCLVFIGFAVGFGSSVWTFSSHQFPNPVKGVGSCVCYAVLFFAALVINIVYELLHIKHYVYIFISFLVSAILSLIFIMFCFKDANDKSLKELKSHKTNKITEAGDVEAMPQQNQQTLQTEDSQKQELQNEEVN